MRFQDAGKQIRGRMIVQIGRYISDPNTVVGVTLATPKPLSRRRLIENVSLGAFLLVFGRGGNCKQRERARL